MIYLYVSHGLRNHKKNCHCWDYYLQLSLSLFFFFNVFVSLLIFWGQCLVIIFLNGIPYIGPEETSRITFRGRSAKVDIYAKRKAHSLGY